MDKQVIDNSSQYKKIYTHPKRKKEENDVEMWCNEDFEDYFKEQLNLYKDEIQYQQKKGYETFKRTVDIVFSLLTIIPAIIIIGPELQAETGNKGEKI